MTYSVIAGITSNLSALQDQNAELPTFRDQATTIADEYEKPAEEIDKLAIARFDEIIAEQNNLITISGNVGLGSTCYSADTTYFTTHYGSMVTGIGTTTGLFTPIHAANPLGIGTTQVVAIASLALDTLTVFRYPKVEDGTLDTSTDNPFVGEGVVNLTTSNAGIGKTTIYTQRAGAATTIYALVNACHTGSATSITNGVAAYNTLSSGISTFIDPVNLIKEEKTQNRLIAWSLGRKIATNTVGITSAENVIDELEDPSLGGPY